MPKENLTPHAARVKKRKITACNECHRRKQKCNRQRPCNYCIDRQVTSKCVYRSYSGSARVASPRSEVAPSPPITQQHDETAQSLSNTLGYARDTPAFHTPVTPATQISSTRGPESRTLSSLLQKLPRSTTTQTLISVFFSEANWYFTVLDRHHFDLSYRRWISHRGDTRSPGLSSDVLCFPALLCQVLAIACHFVPRHLAPAVLRSTDARSLDDFSSDLSDTGEKVLTLIGRHMQAITAIESDLMRCAYLKNSGRGAEAWHSLANSVRQAQDLRLHQEPRVSTDLSSQWEAENKRRLWATIFTWEAHMSLQLGRARMINLADCTIRCPLDCDMPETPSRTLLAIPGIDDAPSHFTSALIKYRLACLIHELMNVGAFRPERVHYPDIVRAQEQVVNILSNLPAVVRSNPEADTSWDSRYPELVRHRLQIAIITNSFLVALHRPHIKQHTESLDAAVAAAHVVLAKSQSLFEITEPHHYKTYTNTFYTIDTAMLLSAIVAILPTEHPERESSLVAIRQAIRRLGVLKSRNTAAAVGEKALLKFLDKLGEDISPDMHNIHDTGMPTPSSFAATSALTTDPMRAMRSLLEDSDAVHNDMSTSVTAASVYNSAQLLPEDSAIFSEIMTDSAYTANWLESANGFSPGTMASLGGQHECCSDWTSPPF